MKKQIEKVREFFATSWAIDNRTSIYVLTIIISVIGFMNYLSIPKEQFPEVVIPYVMVNTVYPGTSPQDMENLVTRPIEKQLKSINDVKRITSNSLQDYSSIVVEFTTDVELNEAKQRVKDAVDKARNDLPSDLPDDPSVMDIDLSEIPIMFINLAGNYDLDRLKQFAELAQDRIETLPEITRVDIVGALDREIQVDVDMYKMQAAQVTFSDIERSISAENLTLSAGSVTNTGFRRNIRIDGQFTNVETLANLVIPTANGGYIFLKDIAEVRDGFKEQESFSRLNGKNVITLNVVKKSGRNLLDASDKIKNIINNELKGKAFPSDLEVTITGDMSRYTRSTLDELNNTILIGFILVTIVLMFFMGFNNAFFVGLAVPISMAVAYIVIPGFGFTLNMIVMFAFIFALGIVVDDAIVVIENTHRIHRIEPDIKKAAKWAAGEVFLPILSGTLTTLAPFVPLAFWPGIVGEFMYYLPVVLIVTLFASMFVAYIINPVFAVSFMKHEYDVVDTRTNYRRLFAWSAYIVAAAVLAFLVGLKGLGNMLLVSLALVAFYRILLKKAISWFQNKAWPWVMRIYESQLRFFLKNNHAYYLFGGLVVLLILSFILVGIRSPKVLFFPDNQPNNIYVFIKLPEGTDQRVTDSVTRMVEKRIIATLGENNPLVESIISNVAIGASEDEFDRSVSYNRGKVTINFVEYKYRGGQNTTQYLDKIRASVKDFPGAEITVDKNRMGPPTGNPINIEITGENLENLQITALRFKKYLDSLNIAGIEELKSDFVANNPEILIRIDRERARREGLSTGQIGMELRTAVYGKEASKFKQDEDEFPIMLRYDENVRKKIDALMNLRITYRDMITGRLRSIPLSAVASVIYADSYASINRKDMKRIITLSSNVLTGYSPNDIVPRIKHLAASFPKPEGVNIQLTGEQEYQAETSAFLGKAMLIAILMIFFILITQFNSFSKSLIILSEVLFSVIGVLLGIVIFNMDIVIIMTGLGIVALGGIVVRNGILIVEFADLMKASGMKTREAIIRAGVVRTTPVILTATATMLGLVPLALGMNINFYTLFTEWNPQLHFGGDNVAFWGPLSWTIIFGLSFSTFLTLVAVPAMYLIAYTMKVRFARYKSNRTYRKRLASS